MQADIELATHLTIEGIEAARSVVALQNDHILTRESETDARRESRHAGTYDDNFIVFSVE